MDLRIETLGSPAFASPLPDLLAHAVDERRRVLVWTDARELADAVAAGRQVPAFEPAGPRARIFFDPGALRCGIVSCGGLCPGVNDVVRAIVLALHYGYGVRGTLGFRYGFAGLAPESGDAPIELSPEIVDRIHEHGGTLLGSSRGPQDVGGMVETLVRLRVQLLFAIGGDGTLRGARALCDEIARRGLRIAVVGIPKTIDNDIAWTERSFGFATAVDEATRVIAAAHTEARGARNGVGLVKLMGRHSGFITAHATLANSDVNFCLVPEVPFLLEGEHGFLSALDARLRHKRHAVVVVAEGAAQDLLAPAGHSATDASGNVRLEDVGPFLRDRMARHCRDAGLEATIRYIDPSYIIRSLPANAFDSEFCLRLGQHAVHAGMAGRTRLLIGYWSQRFTHVPIDLAVGRRKQLDPAGELWRSVLEATGQPAFAAPSGPGQLRRSATEQP